MKITPLDIRRKEFKRSMRGYADEEVDIFLDEVADEFERIFQENMELQDKVHRLDEQIAGHVQLKDALEKTLISAQLQAEELRSNAHKESELILRDAELKARGIVSSSYTETQKTQQALVQLKLLEEDFRFKFRSLLEGYLRLLEEAPLAVAGTESAAVAAEGPAMVAEGPAAAAESPAEPPASVAEVEPPAPVAQVARVEPSAVAVQDSLLPDARLAASPTVAPPAVTPPAVAPPGFYAPAAPLDSYAPAAPLDSYAPAAPLDSYAPAAPAEPPAFRPVPPPAPEPLAGAPTPQPPAMARPPVFEERWPTGGLDEESPTEESPTEEADATVVADASLEDEPVRGFFFGRRMDDMDDTFPGEDGIKKDKPRDFEW